MVEHTSLNDSSSDDGPGGEVYLDDDTPLDMAISQTTKCR
jgi:hypothetical protein